MKEEEIHSAEVFLKPAINLATSPNARTSAQRPIEQAVAAEPMGERQPFIAVQQNGRPFDAECRGAGPFTSDSMPQSAEAFSAT